MEPTVRSLRLVSGVTDESRQSSFSIRVKCSSLAFRIILLTRWTFGSDTKRKRALMKKKECKQ